jgi:outer membrane protein
MTGVVARGKVMKRLCVLILAVVCVAQSVSAQPPLGLTVDDAIRRGLEASHRLAEAAARADMSAAVVDQRRAGSLPQISAQAGYSRTNHVEEFGVLLPNNQLRVIYPDVPDNYRSRLDVQWPIYTGGRLDALERAARAEAGASSDDLAAARSDLRLEITRAYWALVTAGESQQVVDESLNRVRAHLRDVRNQLDAGLIPPSDVLSVEAQESRQRMFTIQARTTRENAEVELARLIGEPGVAIEPSAAFDPPPPRTSPLESLVDEARRQRPERAALLKRIGASEGRQDAAAAGLKPTIAIAGGVDYARPNPRIFPRTEAWRESWDAGVNAVWPLFDGGRSRAEVAEASAATRGMRERLAEFDSVLTVEIRQRMNELVASRAAIEAATDAVRSATEARRVIGERFAAGVAVSVDVLDAQVALLQAGLDRTQAIATARLAEARLDRALGR